VTVTVELVAVQQKLFGNKIMRIYGMIVTYVNKLYKMAVSPKRNDVWLQLLHRLEAHVNYHLVFNFNTNRS